MTKDRFTARNTNGEEGIDNLIAKLALIEQAKENIQGKSKK